MNAVDGTGAEGLDDRAGITLNRFIEALVVVGNRAENAGTTGMPKPAAMQGYCRRISLPVGPPALLPIVRKSRVGEPAEDFGLDLLIRVVSRDACNSGDAAAQIGHAHEGSPGRVLRDLRPVPYRR